MTSNTAGDVRLLGTLGSADGRGVVRLEDRFDTDIQDLWGALTDPLRLARWYGDVEGDLRLGGEFRARLFGSGWEGTGRIDACEPPHRLVIVSKEPDQPTEDAIEVTLTADGDQTVLVMVHTGLPPELLYGYGAGSQIELEDLSDYVAGRDRREATGRIAPLIAAYKALAATVNGPGSLRILGSLRSADGKGVIRMEDRFDTDIEDVWSALTDPGRLRRWIGEVAGDLRLGGEYTFHFFSSGAEGTGRVEACERPRRLLLRHGLTHEDVKTIEIGLTADGKRTLLVAEERGMALNLLAGYGAGIQIHIEDLAAHIAGQERRDDDDARWSALAPAYEELAAKVT